MTEDPLAALRAAGAEFKAARASLDQARTHLLPLMVEAIKNPNITQRAIADASGYTRESVRILARHHGIEKP